MSAVPCRTKHEQNKPLLPYVLCTRFCCALGYNLQLNLRDLFTGHSATLLSSVDCFDTSAIAAVCDACSWLCFSC